jgi:hypothetical protein
LEKLAGWVEKEANSDSLGEVARALATANEQAKIATRHATYHMADNVLHMAHELVDGSKHWIGQNCSASAYAQCMENHDDYEHGLM